MTIFVVFLEIQNSWITYVIFTFLVHFWYIFVFDTLRFCLNYFLPPNFVPFFGHFPHFWYCIKPCIAKNTQCDSLCYPRFYYDGSSLCRVIYFYSDPRLLSTVPSISELVVYANALFGHSWKSFMISGRRQSKIKKNRHFKSSFASSRLISN